MINFDGKEALFIEAYSFTRLTYDEIAKEISIERNEVPIFYDRTRGETKKIQMIRDKYNSILNRGESDFSNFKSFYTWYIEQKSLKSGNFVCCYCGIDEVTLKNLFNREILTSKKFNGTLHIERFNSSAPYSENNCGLACCVCNNAKSDLVTKEDFLKFFVEGIKMFMKQMKEELK